MIIGTAGHIDHGKTSLVKCLTGIDTVRLPEEKQRGITIDLGFAYVPGEDGQIIGFVDVPGHEKFVHTMVSGASGIDHGLLIVAADDGVMPQTREHLRVLELLQIPQVTVAITKVDLVDEARLREVEAQVRAFMSNGSYKDAAIYPVSSRTGQGVDALKQALFAFDKPEESSQDEGFRLAIDRVFVVKGMGIAITGAVTAGRVAVGDSLLLSPMLKTVKVRSIHAQNTPAESASVGQRCGIVITGVEHADVERGQWLLGSELRILTQRVDCTITAPNDSEREIKDGEQILLHHGTEHLLMRVILLNATLVRPGETAFAQCVFDRPLSMCWGDRFVLRDASARHTLAGGRVLDIDPPTRGRKKPERIELLRAVDQSMPAAAIAGLMQYSDRPINVHHWATAMNRTMAAVCAMAQPETVNQVTADHMHYLFGQKAQDALVAKIRNCLEQFHLKEPDEAGLSIERLRRMAAPTLSESLFKAWVQGEIGKKTFLMTGSFVHMSEHKVELSDAERIAWEKAYPRLLEGGYDPPWVRDIASVLSIPEEKVRLILRKTAKSSELMQVVPDLFYPMKTVLKIADIFNSICDKNGKVTVIDFKVALGLGRKRAIQILEALDRVGYSKRLVSIKRVKGETESDHRVIRNRDLFVGKE